jgi:hypothetical protein
VLETLTRIDPTRPSAVEPDTILSVTVTYEPAAS